MFKTSYFWTGFIDHYWACFVDIVSWVAVLVSFAKNLLSCWLFICLLLPILVTLAKVYANQCDFCRHNNTNIFIYACFPAKNANRIQKVGIFISKLISTEHSKTKRIPACNHLKRHSCRKYSVIKTVVILCGLTLCKAKWLETKPTLVQLANKRIKMPAFLFHYSVLISLRQPRSQSADAYEFHATSGHSLSVVLHAKVWCATTAKHMSLEKGLHTDHLFSFLGLRKRPLRAT